MVDEKGDSNNQAPEEDNLKKELSLVGQNIIPLRIAERLEKKLKETNAKINKEQLHTLAYKIRDVYSGTMRGEITAEVIAELISEGKDIGIIYVG